MKKLNITILLSAIFFLFFAGVTGDNNPNQFNCVGTVLKNGKANGPCVLIGSKYVLVSAEYFIDSKFKPEPIKGTSAIANVPYDQKVTSAKTIQVEFNGKTYACKKIILYPVLKNSLKDGNCNIAILVLKDDVQGITPANINTNYDEQQAKVVTVNYEPATGTIKPAGNSAESLIDSLGGYNLNGKSTILFGNLNIPILSNNPNDGMLFAQTSNGWQLTGIGEGNMYQFSTKGDMSLKVTFWTRVSVFADWIKQTTSQ